VKAVVEGQGRPVLLLHGLGMSLEWWRPAIEEFRADNLVCAIDLPSIGDATTPIQSIRRACAELVTGVIRELDAGPTIVVGHSLGGFVASWAAILGAPGIRGLFLVAPGGYGQVAHPLLRLLSFPVLGEIMIATGDTGTRLFLDSVVYDRHALSPAIRQLAKSPYGTRRDFLRQVRMGMRFGRTTPAYRVETDRRLPLPVHFAWGRHDPVHPLDNLATARRLLGGEGQTVFERSGHLPQLEEPEKFYSAVRTFVGGLQATAGPVR
jgi:pimeloyl-ACP methyl ester carboxylesterase